MQQEKTVFNMYELKSKPSNDSNEKIHTKGIANRLKEKVEKVERLIEVVHGTQSNSKLEKIEKQIQSLKQFKSSKFPEYTLYRYLHLWSKLENIYNSEEILTHSINRKKIDINFIDEIIKNDNLFDKENLRFKNDYSDTVLHEACKLQSSILIVEKLLENDVIDLFATNFIGQNILHIAAANNNADLVENLFKTGRVQELLDQKTNIGEEQTVFHYAARNGSYETLLVLKRLLDLNEFKEKVEIKDYQERTCLYLAAEYGNEQIVQMLIDLDCNINVTNIFGQKALYWIISKCPQISKSVLDKYLEVEKYSLKHVDLQPIKKEKALKLPQTESILELLVSTNNLELIGHPIISHLISVKWKEFGSTRAFLDLFFTILYILTWFLLGAYTPAQSKHIYNFPTDGWRVFLWIFGGGGIIGLIIVEIIEFYTTSMHEKCVLNQRKEELKSEKFHPNDLAQISHLEQEKEMCQSRKLFSDYFRDPWNWYDLLSLLMLILVICTHIADVADHSTNLAVTHNSIFTVTVIIVSIRIFEVGRFINRKFGVLVIILTYCIRKILVWMFLYLVFLIPFTTAFFVLFGGKKFKYVKDDDNSDPSCQNSYLIDNANCTSIEVKNWLTYDKIIFDLWVKLYGRDFDTTNMYLIDPIMTQLLIGLFVGLFVLLLYNVFIAMLSSAFEKVYSSAESFFLMERSIKIINMEHQPFFKKKRLNHLKRLETEKSPFEINNKIISTDSDFNDDMYGMLNQLRCDVNNLNERIIDLNSKFDKLSTNEDKSQIAATSDHETNNKKYDYEKLLSDINEMKEIISKSLN